MRKLVLRLAFVAGAIACALAAVTWSRRDRPLPIREILAAYREGGQYGGIAIRYPLDETVFPSEIPPPTFHWEDSQTAADSWLVVVAPDGAGEMSFAVASTQWTPADELWETLKRQSVESPLCVTILGLARREPTEILSAATVRISTSKDEVGSPVFYREVDLPFLTSVTDPAEHIRWRFGTIDSRQQPPIVLDKLPVCGNCHSFSSDGAVMGMDVDYANDRGSYTINPVSPEIVLDKSHVITWSDYRKEDGEDTFGLLSQVSPDGRYVVSTVKDLSVFVPRDDLAFSQLFFPVKGILVVYDRQTGSFQPLPGADVKRFVQSNPTWSPDGKYIVFARSEAHELKRLSNNKKVLLTPDECREFLNGSQTFQFDLYRIAFNEGRGGEPEPLRGASRNGMSNYFPRYSPDGKWIVFCKARSFMLLQPDSELYIIPAEGGEARRMRCNTSRMNSWHSWSPNSRWLVFSSKCNSAYTQLFLTHVDAEGRSSPPVVLDRFTASDKAANIPEFVNAHSGAIRRIREQFVDETSFLYAGQVNARTGFHDAAVRDLEKSLALNPQNLTAHLALGDSLFKLGKLEEAEKQFARAVRIEPENARGHEGLGNALAQQGLFPDAVAAFREALRLDPELAVAHFRLGIVLMDMGEAGEARKHLAEAVRLDPYNAKASYSLAISLANQGKLKAAVPYFRSALKAEPDFVVALVGLASILATSTEPAVRDPEEAVRLATRACELTQYRTPLELATLSDAHAAAGRFVEAAAVGNLALQAALGAGNAALAETIEQRVRFYRQGRPLPNAPRG